MLDAFGSGETVAVFARFTGHVGHGRLTVVRVMEDTFATAMSFRTRGVWHSESDSDGGEVMIGAEDA